jgi:S-layer protein
VNAATGNTFTPGDTLTGTGSNAALILADAGNAALTTALISPGGAALSNVKTLTINGSNVAANVLSTSGSLFSGVNTVNVTQGGQVALTLGSAQAGNLNLTATAALASSVNGGTAVTVTSAGATTGTLDVGQTTAGTGAATVTVTGAAFAAATDRASGAINVRSGTSATVTQNAYSNTTAAATDADGGTNTLGAVAIDGTATTVSATSTQTNAAAEVLRVVATATIYGVTGQAGVINGGVTVRDATAIAGTAATTAGTLATVTLSGYGNSTISSNALTTVNLAGTGGTLGITTGLTSPTNRALALNLNSATNVNQLGLDNGANTITDSTAPSGSGFTTINITNTGSSRVTGIAAVDATTLTMAGSGTVTVGTVNTMTNLQTFTVTGAAGFSSGGAFAGTVTSINASGTTGSMTVNLAGLETAATFTGYTGGSGVDTVTIATAPTVSINGGAGTSDVIVNNAATDIVVGNPNITGFEILRAGAVATGNLSANGFTGLQTASTSGAGAVVFTNVAAGTALTIQAVAAGTINNTTYNLANSTGTSDAVTINLVNSATANGLIEAGTVSTTGIEAITISMTDTPNALVTGQQTGRNAALINTITLNDADAETITVTGNAGLNLTNTALTSVTSFDASGVVIGTAKVAGAVTYTSATTKANSLTTTIIGGAGADVLTGGATADTINGGAGNDTIDGGLGADTIDGGAGTNTASWASITTGAEGEGVGSGSISGIAINLSSKAVSAATINTAMGGTVGLSGSLTSVAANSAAYIFPTQNVAFSTVVDTLANIRNIIGSSGTDYIVAADSVSNTIRGGLGADQIVLTETAGTVSAADTVVFTSGLSIDAVTGFNVADDIAAFDLSDLETANAVFAGATLDFVNGDATSVAAGATITVQAVAANFTLGATTNVLNYTAATVANAAALETALEALTITNGANALAVNDSFVIQYTQTTTNAQMLAVATVTNVTAGGAAVGANWEVTDIASLVGGIADLTAVNYSFIA